MNALRAWFNGAANNFVLTQRDAGVRLIDIIKAVVDFDGAQSSAANQPPLDLTAVRVTQFLNEQPADQVLLVRDHRLSAKRQYQVVPPKVKQMPVDRHRNSVAVRRTTFKRLKTKAANPRTTRKEVAQSKATPSAVSANPKATPNPSVPLSASTAMAIEMGKSGPFSRTRGRTHQLIGAANNRTVLPLRVNTRPARNHSRVLNEHRRASLVRPPPFHPRLLAAPAL